jgi:TATA-binding protein-associated factor Taf7
MVKNTMGGCNGKKVAHKHAVKSTKSGLRISQNKSEIYGVVKRLNGNTFDVTCIDEKDRRCFIRGKFKGRGKRDNIIEVDKWVLIGLREFQQAPSELVLVNGKREMEMCDLLEVYSSSEKETLKRTHGIYMKESELARSIAATAASEETFQFVDTDTLRYQKIASQKVETIRLKAEQRITNNNIIDQSAFYSDIESGEDDDESGEDDDDIRVESNKNNNKKNSSNESEEEESEEEESEEEESEEEESEEEESEEEEKNKNWNKNKRAPNVYKEEIDVDDI